MFQYIYIFLIIVFAQGCEIAINTDLSDPQPLLLKPSAANGQYLTEPYYLPDNYGILYVSPGSVINFNCPGGIVLVDGIDTGSSAVEGTCTGIGKNFNMVGVGNASFETITCSQHTIHIARYTDNACLNNYEEVEIGFELADGRFIREIEICFDKVEQHTRYSRFILSRFIGGFQAEYPPASFSEGIGFYNLPENTLDTLYSRNTQRAVINNLVGLPSDSKKYISDTSNYYLAIGHLTAKADFIYGAKHRLTFYYINAAPQWQTFNDGNWLALEESLKKFVVKRQNNLEVYTGSYGKATLPHDKTGIPVELALYIDASGGQIGIPVPAIYWKVVYDPISQQGVAFIGVNNPYLQLPVKICKDVCGEVTYLNWKPTDIKTGFSYCCEVEALRKVVKDIPELLVTSLLK